MIRCPSCKQPCREDEFPTRIYKGRVLTNPPCKFCRRMDYLAKHGPTVSQTLDRFRRQKTELTEASLGLPCR